MKTQLEEYFAGNRTTFDIPLAAEGAPFEREVWRALEEIPYGETVSYGEIARRVGQPTAARAVGTANGRNPIAVIVPCHRVIGADGSLTGYLSTRLGARSVPLSRQSSPRERRSDVRSSDASAYG